MLYIINYEIMVLAELIQRVHDEAKSSRQTLDDYIYYLMDY